MIEQFSRIIKKILRKSLEFFGIALCNKSTFDNLLNDRNSLLSLKKDIQIVSQLSNGISNKQLMCLGNSRAQLGQDLFVLSHLGYKRNGFFIEFGATNGFDLSNTYLLEKNFGWTGILAEPGKCWHSELIKNRNCFIDTLCVWKNTGATIKFNETISSELSTIDEFSNCDFHKDIRKFGITYDVETISLLDILKKHSAPKLIDYLSIDTEGSEYEILSNFDFSQYDFQIITCEHNYSPMREKINKLLTENGYKRIQENISQFDDWYVKS